MIKIEKERKYNDFEKEVIRIIVNYEPIAIYISFEAIYKIITKNLFDNSISFDYNKGQFGILRTYVQNDDDLILLYHNLSSKIRNLTNLLVYLENSNLIKFHSGLSTDTEFDENMYFSKPLDSLGIKEDVKIILEKNKSCMWISYELKDLVKRDFMTDEEIRFNKEMKIAKSSLKTTQNALKVSIFMGFLSLIISLYTYYDNKKSNPKTELIITDETKKNMVEILNTTDKEDFSKQELLEIIKNLSKENPKEQNKKIEAK